MRVFSTFLLLLLALSVPTVHAQPVPPGAPGKPTGFSCSAVGSQVTCTWTAGPGAAADVYILTIDPEGDPSRRIILEVGGTTFSRLFADGVYFAYVEARNAFGRSGPAETQFAVPGINAPRNLTAAVSGREVTLRWDLPNTGERPRVYEVEIGIPGVETPIPCPVPPDDPSCRLTKTVSVAALTATVSVPDGVYVARVRSVGVIGKSNFSDDVTFIVGPPPSGAVPFPPSGLRADVADTTVTLNWNLRHDSPSAENYLIDVMTESGMSTTFATGSSNRTVTATAAPGRYTVRVRGQNGHGISQMPSEALVVGVRQDTTCNTTLGAPTGLNATRSGNVVTLTWARPVRSTNLSSYVIEVGSSDGLSDLFNFSTGNQATLISGAVPSGTYYIRVKGQDSCSRSAASNQVTVTVP